MCVKEVNVPNTNSQCPVFCGAVTSTMEPHGGQRRPIGSLVAGSSCTEQETIIPWTHCLGSAGMDTGEALGR